MLSYDRPDSAPPHQVISPELVADESQLVP
jgi:hypothetical protein